ncbi:MAG TPA: mammalian cell entry protein, partial [Mycobacterium sp.]|nr:mammalian cell entry protein [Mycobacterium sp.]
SAKLCVQYLAPIIKNRQYNTFPFGVNPFVGASARPNEITYSEDRLNPHLPPIPTDAGQGLEGLMVPPTQEPAPPPLPAEGTP